MSHFALKYPAVGEECREIVNQDISRRKVFVCKLDPATTSQSLHSVFVVFGDVIEAVVIYDKNTKNSKGYGFVTFADSLAAELSLQEPYKLVDGKPIEASLALTNKENKDRAAISHMSMSGDPSVVANMSLRGGGLLDYGLVNSNNSLLQQQQNMIQQLRNTPQMGPLYTTPSARISSNPFASTGNFGGPVQVSKMMPPLSQPFYQPQVSAQNHLLNQLQQKQQQQFQQQYMQFQQHPQNNFVGLAPYISSTNQFEHGVANEEISQAPPVQWRSSNNSSPSVSPHDYSSATRLHDYPDSVAGYGGGYGGMPMTVGMGPQSSGGVSGINSTNISMVPLYTHGQIPPPLQSTSCSSMSSMDSRPELANDVHAYRVSAGETSRQSRAYVPGPVYSPVPSMLHQQQPLRSSFSQGDMGAAVIDDTSTGLAATLSSFLPHPVFVPSNPSQMAFEAAFSACSITEPALVQGSLFRVVILLCLIYINVFELCLI